MMKTIRKTLHRLLPLPGALLVALWPGQALALDSYRYLHVNIDTLWVIFVFLFFLVFAPMILMVVLYWWNAVKKSKQKGKEE